MIAVAEISDAVKDTHQDRPSPKRMLPFRIVSFTVAGKLTYAIEYDIIVPVPPSDSNIRIKYVRKPDGSREEVFSGDRIINPPHKSPQQIIVEPHFDGCHSQPLGRYIKELCEAFWEKESQVDGLNAKIDTLTTDKVLLEREVEKLQNQLREANSRNGKKEK